MPEPGFVRPLTLATAAAVTALAMVVSPAAGRALDDSDAGTVGARAQSVQAPTFAAEPLPARDGYTVSYIGHAGVVEAARRYLGAPYVLGGISRGGIDCSGLVKAAYRAIGLELPHDSGVQAAMSTRIPRAEAVPGDLVFYEDRKHVAIYLGDGLIIQASDYHGGVAITPVFSTPHFFARLNP